MVWTAGPQGTLAPSLVALFRQADAGWPDRLKLSDGSLGDTAHASRTSDHNPKAPNPPGWVDAGDLTRDDVHGPDIDALWAHLIDTRDQRVKYLIHRGRIVKSYADSAGRPAWEPQPYYGPSPHDHHIHISVTPDGRFDTGPWFASEPAAGPPPPAAPTLDMEDAVYVFWTGANTPEKWYLVTDDLHYVPLDKGAAEQLLTAKHRPLDLVGVSESVIGHLKPVA